MSELLPQVDFPMVPIADYTAALDDVRAAAEAATGARVGEGLAELLVSCERALRFCPATQASVLRRDLERSLLDLVLSVAKAQLVGARAMAGAREQG